MTVTVPDYGFPDRYNENYVVLLVRDPNCIFAYWEFSKDQMDLVAKEFGCPWGEVDLILRVYDLTGLSFNGENAHSYFDVSVHSLANNYYFKEVNANHSYCVEVGVVTVEGRFVNLLRSNVVQTPRDSLADGSGIVMADLLDRLDKSKDIMTESGDSWQSIETYSSDSVYNNPEDEEDEG